MYIACRFLFGYEKTKFPFRQMWESKMLLNCAITLENQSNQDEIAGSDQPLCIQISFNELPPQQLYRNSRVHIISIYLCSLKQNCIWFVFTSHSKISLYKRRWNGYYSSQHEVNNVFTTKLYNFQGNSEQSFVMQTPIQFVYGLMYLVIMMQVNGRFPTLPHTISII